MLSPDLKITRVNHVPEILKRRKMSLSDFLHEAGYQTRLSRPTLYKAARGDEIDYETAEKLAWFFDVTPADVLESKFE